MIINNRKSYFKNTCVTVIGTSDFPKPRTANLKSQTSKASRKTFAETKFNDDLKSKLGLIDS